MSRCFPFPPPGYENEKKLSNGELGHVHKKRKHKDKKEKKEKKKEESKDKDQVNHVTEKKDKKHKHHKHKKDKREGRQGEHELEDIKTVGVAQDSSTRREAVSIKFVERERPGTDSSNKVHISDSECSRQNKDKIRDNSDGNGRKRKEIDTNFFLGLRDADDSFNKRETIGIKFVERERLGNGKCAKIYLSEREESRQNNCKTRDNGMEKDQKTGKDEGKSNGKVRKGKEIDTESSLHGGNAQEIPKKREAISFKFVERERLYNGKCDKINLLDNQKFLRDKDNNNGIVRKRNEIDTNSSSNGNRPWVHLPVLTDKDKWSTKHFQTTLAKEVYSDIERTAQESKDLVECISMSCVQNASNHALGKSVDSTSFHLSLSGRDKRSLKSLQTTSTKEDYFNTGKAAQEVKNGPVECIQKTRLEEASNASFEQCIASTSHPLFSVKDKPNKCPQAACAEEVHSDSGNKVKDAKGCAVGCIPGTTVQVVSKDSLEKCVASVTCHPSTTCKERCSNKRSQTASIEVFNSDSWRKVQDSKDCAVECLRESRNQRGSNAALEKCVASTSCHLSFSIKDKRSSKHPQTAFPEEVLLDSGRIGQEANGVAVECKTGSRVQEASTATLQKCVTSTSSLPSFSGKDCERNGVADCKTTSHFIGPSHCTTEAVDVVPSGSRADEHILDLKYFHSVPPKQGFSDMDNQAWLFLSNGRKSKATETFDHVSNVWDRLLVLQPNNTYALPYVTPF